VKKNEEKQDKSVKEILKKVSILMIILFGGFYPFLLCFPVLQLYLGYLNSTRTAWSHALGACKPSLRGDVISS
jgi:hypothetical protein